VSRTPFTSKDLAAALAVVVIWGLNFVAMKFALRDFTPFQLGAARYVFAALPLVLLVKFPRMHWKWVVLYGLCQGVGQFGFLFSALQVGMTAALTAGWLGADADAGVFYRAVWFCAAARAGGPPAADRAVTGRLGLLCFAINYMPGRRHGRHHGLGPGAEPVRGGHVGRVQHRGPQGPASQPGV
jgi:O-acetylserine/cysteine efflux transporter